jgi:hypothetical protein
MQCQSLAEALVCNLDMPAARQPRHWFCVSLTRTIGEAHFFGGRCDADHTSRRQQERAAEIVKLAPRLGPGGAEAVGVLQRQEQSNRRASPSGENLTPDAEP